MISAQKLLENISFNEQNELRLETWEQNKTDIPLEAFFYITGSNVGLKSSQKDQQDFSDVYGQFVPIIQISLPTSQQADAQFYYNAGDQVIQP